MELLTNNKEQITENKGQRTENREQRTKKREQRAESFIICYLLFVICYLFSGCSTLMQKTGDLLEGNASKGKTLALYRSLDSGAARTRKETETIIELRTLRLRDGEEIVEIHCGEWPGLVIRGTLPQGGGNFDFTDLDFLTSHVHGWNDFTLDLMGSAVFYVSGNTIGRLIIADEVERVQISSARIRLKSSRLTGNAALGPLRNRRERILALIEWMDEWLEKNQTIIHFEDQKEFENYWKPKLFPELVSKSRRPAEYSKENAEWIRADSIKWNRTYTEFLFDENLWEYRNTGALLRDWEEALPWIFMEYSWDTIIGSLNETNLIKIN